MSTTTKHTKGEWKLISSFCEVNGIKHYVGEIYGTSPERYENIARLQCCSHIRNPETSIHREEAEANAKLIASAPELLEALIVAKKCLDDNGLFGCTIIDEAIKKATE